MSSKVGRSRYGRHRRPMQWIAALGFNAYFPGFLAGMLYRGPLKVACVPVLNCYSCPGALFSCPVGAAQNAAVRGYFPLYVVGFLGAVGALMGRIPCGWLCPFGLFQELPWRGKTRLALPGPAHWVKYGVLAALLPWAAWPGGTLDMGYERFCTYLCPGGTLTASVPLLIADPTLRTLAGPLLAWRFLLLGATIAAGALLLHRPFCRTLCPLGVGLGLANRVSLWAIAYRGERCTDCGACRAACPVDLDPTVGGVERPECLRCLRCVDACPEAALEFGLRRVREGGV